MQTTGGVIKMIIMINDNPQNKGKRIPANCWDTFSLRPLSLTRQLTAIQQKLFDLKLLHIFPINAYLKKQILYNFGKKTHPCTHQL